MEIGTKKSPKGKPQSEKETELNTIQMNLYNFSSRAFAEINKCRVQRERERDVKFSFTKSEPTNRNIVKPNEKQTGKVLSVNKKTQFNPNTSTDWISLPIFFTRNIPS